MLLSMSKRYFTSGMFTAGALDVLYMSALPSSEDVWQLLSFQTIGDFCFSSPAMDGFSVCLSQLITFFCSYWSHLEQIRMPGLAKGSLRPCTPDTCLQSVPAYGCLFDLIFGPDTRRSAMKDVKRSHGFISTATSGVSFEVKNTCEGIRQITQARRFNFSTCSAEKPEDLSFSSTRCSEKGCVFPASSRGSGRCSYHLHQQEEPFLFRSHQPSGLLLDPARSMPTEKDEGRSRKRDRQRMTAIWEQFQSDGMAYSDDPILK